MRRRTARPFGSTVSPTRIVSLLFAVALLAVFYDRAKDPATWRWFTDEQPGAAEVEADGSKGPDWAKIDANLVPGPNDRDPAERDAAAALLDLVRDKTKLRPQEMAAYWKLMAWARAEPFRDLEKRARPEIPFVQIWEQPARYRGDLIRIRMHVARVLDFESPARNERVPHHVYEAWGWTDDSKSLPYVVVFPDLPEGLAAGNKAGGEIVFVGYFLKIMSYTPADASREAPFRGAPLLVGRARPAISAAPVRRPAAGGELTPPVIALVALGAVAIVGLGLWSAFRGRPRRRRRISAGTGQPRRRTRATGTIASRRKRRPFGNGSRRTSLRRLPVAPRLRGRMMGAGGGRRFSNGGCCGHQCMERRSRAERRCSNRAGGGLLRAARRGRRAALARRHRRRQAASADRRTRT
jgi:hypothetical protein